MTNLYRCTLTEFQMEMMSRDLDKFNKIARKLNCTEATMVVDKVVTDTDPAELVKRGLSTNNFKWNVPNIVTYEASITGGVIIAGDYTFVGSLNHTRVKDRVLVYSMPGLKVPSCFHGSAPVCNHCEKKRNRTYTFIVKNNETGEHLQVGSTCLHDFLGHDVADLIKALKLLVKFSDIDENYKPVNTRKTVIEQFDPRNILMLTNATIRVFGWAARASETHTPTADVIRTMCLTPDTMEGEYWLRRVNEDRKDATDAMVADAVIKWINADEGRSGYMANLKREVNAKYVTVYNFGLLASAIESYKKNLTEKLEKKADYAQDFVGSIGDRLELDVECVDIRTFEGYDGPIKIHRFLDKERHVFIWFTSTGKEIPLNQKIKIKGTIKKHEVYQDVPQNSLSRVTRIMV